MSKAAQSQAVTPAGGEVRTTSPAASLTQAVGGRLPDHCPGPVPLTTVRSSPSLQAHPVCKIGSDEQITSMS